MSEPAGFTPTLIEEMLAQALGHRADIALRDRLLRQLMASAVAGGARVAEEMGIAELVGPTHPVLQRLGTNHTPKILAINVTTRERLRDGLLTAIADGQGIREQVKVVREVFQQADRSRAMTIARTENTIFWHVGSRQQMLEGGSKGHIWITSRDIRVRPSHDPMDGQCQAIDVAFTSGAGVKLLHPGDPGAPIGEIANCRCTEAPVVRGCDARSLLFGTPERRALYWKATIATIEAQERLALRVVRSIFREQREEVLALVARLFPRTG